MTLSEFLFHLGITLFVMAALGLASIALLWLWLRLRLRRRGGAR